MNFELPKEKRIDETEEFKNFSEEIDYTIEFFNRLSDLICFNRRIISFLSKTELLTLNANLIDSAAQTLRSIKLCCSIGSFSDANTLIRKLRDDLIQYIYILNIINLRKPFIEESIKDLKLDEPEHFADTLSNLQYNNILTDDEQAVTAWLKNTVSDLQRPIKKKLEFENYMKVLKQNANINQILIKYNLEEYWESLRKKLNNYVHNNGTSFSRHNFISVNDEYLETHLKNINIRTSYISSFFLVVLLMIESALISSTDYIDHLDCNLEPPEDSQYLIANFVQDFIDNKISKIHPELKQYLKDNNIHGMKIE
jgi:hypothetical protein